MNTRILSFTIALAAAVALNSGCGGPKKPEGLPNLVPCQATFTQDSAPLADASVRLVPQGEGADARWAVAGVTDAKGVAVFLTHGQFKGAPVGSYRVVVSKEVSETENKKVKMFSTVDPKYTNQTTTDLTLDVGEKGASESFDVGASVKVFLEEFDESDDP